MAVVKSFQAIYKPWKGSHTMPTFALTPDVSLELDEPVARRLYRRMHEHFASQDTRTSDAAILDDNHPLWERHSGRSGQTGPEWRSEEHTSELQSLMRISYAVFCLKKKHTLTTYT